METVSAGVDWGLAESTVDSETIYAVASASTPNQVALALQEVRQAQVTAPEMEPAPRLRLAVAGITVARQPAL